MPVTKSFVRPSTVGQEKEVKEENEGEGKEGKGKDKDGAGEEERVDRLDSFLILFLGLVSGHLRFRHGIKQKIKHVRTCSTYSTNCRKRKRKLWRGRGTSDLPDCTWASSSSYWCSC